MTTYRHVPQKIIPLEQGLKLYYFRETQEDITPQKIIPLEQGLKLEIPEVDVDMDIIASEDHSIRTRIETLFGTPRTKKSRSLRRSFH